MAGILKVVYQDGRMEEKQESALIPGSFGWSLLGELPLTRMEVILPQLGTSILLTGYEAYNLLTRRGARNPMPVGLWLMGKTGGLVDVSYLDFGSASLRRDQLPLGLELDGAASLGWRAGYVPEGATAGTFLIPLAKNQDRS